LLDEMMIQAKYILEETPETPLLWVPVKGSYWRNPLGFGSSIDEILDHPVVHVSHLDAATYCKFEGSRLPGEKEFEVASRSGYWGENFMYPDGSNDSFGKGEGLNSEANTTSAIDYYSPNSMGVYDLLGNVYEWQRGGERGARILKGGSYVDSINGLTMVQITTGSRQLADGDMTSGNIGFRCARSLERVVNDRTRHKLAQEL